MRLAILGGTGRTGRLLIDQALERGHSLKVLARDPDRLHRRHDQLPPVTGDARDESVYDALLDGTEVVLSALGPVKGDVSGVMTLAAQHLTGKMPHHRLSRVISLTGAGVPHPGDTPKLIDTVVRALLRFTQPEVLADSVRHADLLRASDLAWTLVRVPRLTDGPARPLLIGRVGTIRPMITRASTSQFMLDAAEQGTSLKQAPAISN